MPQQYTAEVGWGAGLPDVRGRDVSDVAVGPNDEVYLLYREPSFVVVADRHGALCRRFGEGELSRPHGVMTTGDRTYVVDEGADRVLVFDRSGRMISQIGTGPSDPEFPRSGMHVDRITSPHGPFTRPTRLAIAGRGRTYVSDGYGNCRIHAFDEAERLVRSWGEPGNGPGEFRIPHALTVDEAGRVLVCDRENDRIQVFDSDGRHVETWSGLQRPNAIQQGEDGLLYVAEGRAPSGAVPSGIAIHTADGRRVTRLGTDRPDEPGGFVSAHGMAVDSEGSIYVAECVAALAANFPGAVSPNRVAVQKLRRTAA